MKRILLSFMFLFTLPLFAKDSDGILTAEEILAAAHAEQPTTCASKVFAKALDDHRYEISESAPEAEVRAWAQVIMFDKDVLQDVLKCPEIQSVDKTKTIIFTPIVFEFDNGRTITINYTTQPKVLEQKLLLAKKPSLPNGDPNPKLMDENDPAIYINTTPSWYAIMVVEHGTLANFVGPDKNNTLSIKWIDENIDSIYPKGFNCTSKSAIANDNFTINQVVHQIADIEDDPNDYYVAGDVNLEWIMYAEIAADVIITVATAGTGQIATGALKGARATKTGIRLAKNMRKFKKSAKVLEYIDNVGDIAKTAEKISKFEKNIANAKKYEKAIKNAERARQAGRDATKYEKQAEKILESAKKIDPDITEDMLKNPTQMEESLKNLRKESAELSKALDETLKENKQILASKKTELSNARKKVKSVDADDWDKKYDELQKLYDLRKDQSELKNAKDRKKNEEILQQINDLEQSLKSAENASEDLANYAKLRREVDDLEAVDKYITTSKEFENMVKYRNELRAFKRPQTGNIITRSIKSIRAANSGAKELRKAEQVARAGMSSRSAKISNYLFDSTLKHGARIARFARDAGLIYGTLAFLGDMYDQTSDTSKEYSNGIEFKPLGLLSADDLEGQDNVVNYGMWLMWEGNSTDPADDDAAYLQVMDFATKFQYVLNEYQSQNGANCNVDIYVVRPIIRLDESDQNNTTGELFYLFMNEEPWTTAN